MSIFIIGLTGQTGAGKSSAAGHFKSLGAYVIDCDILAREVTEPGSPTLEALSERFGSDIIRADGTLDRRELARRAFSTPQGSAALNAITHPAITGLARKKIAEAQSNGCKAAILDAALLLQSPLREDCDAVVCVCAPQETRAKRLSARDGISENDIRQRMSAQPPEEYYRANSDIIINNGDGADIAALCAEVFEKLPKLIEEKRRKKGISDGTQGEN